MSLNTPGAQSVPQLIQTLGLQASAAINDGAEEVVFDATVKDIIGHHGMQQLIDQFCYWEGKPGTFSIEQGSVRIFPQTEDVEGTMHDSPPPAGKKNHTPRPPNAFILYRKAHHPNLKAGNPELHNNQISVILGNQWRNESEVVKQHFYRLAQELKDQHSVEHPDYVYRPRKTTEKKRRMSRKKAAKLNKLFDSLTQGPDSNGIEDILAVTAAYNGETHFGGLATDGKSDFVLLGDLDLGQDNLDSLLENREIIEPEPVDPKDPITDYHCLYGNGGGLSGYVAPSTAMVIDDANSIIQWAEKTELTPIKIPNWARMSPEMQYMRIAEKLARSYKLTTAAAQRQKRMH